MLGIGPSAEIEVALNGIDGRRMGTLKDENNEPKKHFIYSVRPSDQRIKRM